MILATLNLHPQIKDYENDRCYFKRVSSCITGNSPELFALIGLYVEKGGEKSKLMATVNSLAAKNGLTAGLCEAAYDFFKTDAGKVLLEQWRLKK